MKRILCLLALSWGFATAAAQTATTEALPFLRFQRDPATLGMAGAGSSMTDGSRDGVALLVNPAARLFSASRLAVNASYASWFPKAGAASSFQGGVSVKLAKGLALTAGAAYQKDAEAFADYTPNALVAGGAVSVAPSASFALGVAVKYGTMHYTQDMSLSGVAIDVMAQIHRSSWNLAAGVQSLGSKVKSSTGEYALPTSLKAAADYTLDLSAVSLTAAADADYFLKGSLAVSAGLQARLYEYFVLRTGYRYATPGGVLPSMFSLGGGAEYAGVALNLSYVLMDAHIAGTLMAGLSYSF